MQAVKRRIDFDPFSFNGVVIVSLVYGLLHALVRLTAGINLALDDTKENLFTQSLEWGYLPDNPPLYEWALNVVQLFTGPTLFSFLILKYALLTCTAIFLFLAGKRLFQDEKWAAVTVYATTLLYQLGYNYHQAFSHSLMVIAAVSLALWAFIRLFQERRFRDYLIFGLAVGLGLISKYNFTGFLAVILVPAMLDREIRKVIVAPSMLVALALASIIALPHVLWVYERQELFLSYVTNKLGQTNGSHLGRAGEGMGNGIVAVVSFYLPFLIVAFFIFRGAFKKEHFLRSPEEPVMRLLARSNLAAVALIFAGVLLFGVSNVTERYVIPFFIPGFFWMMWVIRELKPADQIGRLATVIAGGVCIIFLIRLIGISYPDNPVCDECQRWRPYYALKETIERENIDETAIFIGYEEDTSGNLRRLLPRADVRSFNLLFYNSIKTDVHKSCYFVWSEELLGQTVEEKVRHLTDGILTLKVSGEWRHPFKQDGWRNTEWGISPIPSESPLYKTLCTPPKNS